VTVKEFSGKEFKTPRGSLRSLRVPSPVLVTVVVTFKFCNPSTLTVGVVVLRVKPGAAETAIAETTRARREENIVRKVVVMNVVSAVKAIEEGTSLRV